MDESEEELPSRDTLVAIEQELLKYDSGEIISAIRSKLSPEAQHYCKVAPNRSVDEILAHLEVALWDEEDNE